MKRSIKNMIIILLIAAVGVGAYFTMDYAGAQLGTGTSYAMQGDASQQPPELPSGEAPSMPDGEPPSKPSDDSNAAGNTAGQPPELPSGEAPSMPSEGSTQDTDTTGATTATASGNTDNTESTTDNQMQPPAMPSEMENGKSSSLDTKWYLLLALEALLIALLFVYLILSGFNKKTFKETLKSGKRLIAYILCVALMAGGLTFGGVQLTEKVFADSAAQGEMMPGGAPGQPEGGNTESVEASGATTVDGKEQTLSESYASATSDENAILVTNGGNATVNSATISKTGDAASTESADFSGVNAAVLVQEGSTATIKDATITTDAKGGNAVFATGEDAKIYISDSTIKTTGTASSRGLDATYGGYIEADNVNITTQGGSCAALATDRGEGTVIVSNSTLETNGAGSPVIYSTGDIRIDNTTGTANGAQNVVVEGKNSATVTNSTLTASGKGNRGDVDNAGVMIYQSMSGDAGEGTGTLTATDSTLAIQQDSSYYKSAPMFFITNTDAVINLKNTKLDFGSGVLVSAKGTSEWGNEGSNGGNLTFNAENQTLTGNIVADSISAVTLNLTASSYEGTINGDNTAKEITLKLDKDSKIKLTGDSYVTALDDADDTYANIDFNGFTLYVNGKAINQ